ncbi:MAG: tRNA (adenosine(37)-N6)-dimethylallyltransferase MiaA [Crocinitomicaceae bacterium]
MAELTPPTKKTLIVISGPTAVGKTRLSIQLAKHFKCPILSYDSRQFYHEMTIGTAKPSVEELAQAEHHFINSRSIKELYTAGMYEQDAVSLLHELFKTHDYCIAVGGSGLYIDALCYGIDDIPSDPGIRKKLADRWKNEGLEALQEEVRKIDPDYYESADMKNPRRVMRALEVYEITGKTYTSYRTRPQKERNFNSIRIGLEMEQEKLYKRVDHRVDQMIQKGLLEEVKNLLPHKHLKALKTVGYRELIDYFEEKTDLNTAVELVKRNSRRFARKQYTWFRKNKAIKWFQSTDEEAVINYLESIKSK